MKKSTGRFDLTIEDEHEILTNTVMQDDQLVNMTHSYTVVAVLLVLVAL